MKNNRALWIAGVLIVIYLVALVWPLGDDIVLEDIDQSNDAELASEQSYDIKLLQGRWQSLDDELSVVEFIDNKKIDYYSGKKIVEDSFKSSDNHIIIGAKPNLFEYQIIDLSDDDLTLISLPRGNILKYMRI